MKNHDTRKTRDQMLAFGARHGLTYYRDIARYFAVSPDTVRAWMSSKRPNKIPRTVGKMMDLADLLQKLEKRCSHE